FDLSQRQRTTNSSVHYRHQGRIWRQGPLGKSLNETHTLQKNRKATTLSGFFMTYNLRKQSGLELPQIVFKVENLILDAFCLQHRLNTYGIGFDGAVLIHIGFLHYVTAKETLNKNVVKGT